MGAIGRNSASQLCLCRNRHKKTGGRILGSPFFCSPFKKHSLQPRTLHPGGKTGIARQTLSSGIGLPV